MKKRDLTFKPEMETIIQKCEICNMGMIDEEGFPYVLPMNFGYEDGYIYFHSSRTGKKIEVLKNNNNVCISFSADEKLQWVNEQVACSWGMQYKSVLAFGTVEFVDDYDLKVDALKIFMKNYSDIEFSFNAPAVKDILIFRVKIEVMKGRALGC